MNLLLMSSSRSANTGFLEANADAIAETLKGVNRAVLISYAQVSANAEVWQKMMNERFAQFGISIDRITEFPDPAEAVERAEAVLVSGGNTFCLLKALYEKNLLNPLRKRVYAGMPYIGWSAGSNVAGKSIRTTNDMPIVYPPSFDALGFLPLQLNPHYTDAMPEGLRGETRQQRIEEFLAQNPNECVLGLPEGDALRVTGAGMRLIGEHDAWLFRAGETRQRLLAGRDLSHLL